MNPMTKTGIGILASLCMMMLIACASGPSMDLDLAESKKYPGYDQDPASRVAVMALYSDEESETRALIENSFTNQLNLAGTDATAGYKLLDSYTDLEGRIDEIVAALDEKSIQAVILIDPYRAMAYDPADYAKRRAVYKSLGLDSSEFFENIGSKVSDSDSGKYFMEVTFWDRRIKQFAWVGIFEIDAPDGYDLAYARQFSAEFARQARIEMRKKDLLR